MCPAFTVTHSLEAIEELLEAPLVRYRLYLKQQAGEFFEQVVGGSGDQSQLPFATVPEVKQDLERALVAKGNISQMQGKWMWQCPRCQKYKTYTTAKFCALDGHPCIMDDSGTQRERGLGGGGGGG